MVLEECNDISTKAFSASFSKRDTLSGFELCHDKKNINKIFTFREILYATSSEDTHRPCTDSVTCKL